MSGVGSDFGAAGPLRQEPLEDRVDRALEEMWRGNARPISELFGRVPGIESDIAKSVGEARAPDGMVDLLGDAPALASLTEELSTGTRVGGYTIATLLGRGGMGSVYAADQDRPRRRVALKFLRAGPFADPLAVSWFEREADALARMEHPGIARVLEAGIDGGRHFLAMELVEGLSIDRYADERDLSISDRVTLFSRVVDAVCSAHRRGVIHRDLKPGNVLVPEDGQPRILDFGLARLEQEGSSEDDRSRLTHADMRAGTLPYMSPEQIRGDARDVDARTDVYSLGVMLFELLTGSLPFELPQARYDAERVIVERGAIRLRSAKPTLDRDLDAIVAMALAKKRGDRYPSADALLADLERFRERLPVRARPPELLDGLRKLVSRHRIATSLVVATTSLLLLAFGMTVLALSRARRAETEARDQGARAGAVGGFLADLIGRTNPDLFGPDRTLREVLAQAASELPNRSDLDPAARAELHGTIGRSLQGLGDLKGARIHLESALSIHEELHRVRHRDLAGSLRDLAFLDHAESRFEASESGHRAALAMRRELLGENSPETLQSREELARVLHHRGRWAEARRELESGLSFAREAGDHGSVFRILCELGDILVESYEPRAGGDYLSEALGLAEEQLRSEDVERAREALARAKLRLGEYDSAKHLLEENIVAQRERLGMDNPALARSLGRLGFVCQQRGELEEGRELLEASAIAYGARFGPNAAVSLASWGRLAGHMMASGETTKALANIRDLLQRSESALGLDHTQSLLFRRMLSRALFDCGRAEEAIAETDIAMAVMINRIGADHFQVAETWCQRAFFHAELGELSVARRDYGKALAVIRAGSASGTLMEQDSLAGLAQTSTLLEDHEAAATWYRDLARLRRSHFGDHPLVADAWALHAREARAAGLEEMATVSIAAALETLERAGVSLDRLSAPAYDVLQRVSQGGAGD